MLLEDFHYISRILEEDYPGFQIAIREKGATRYGELKSELEHWIRQNTNATPTVFIKELRIYLAFFKDKHLRAYDPALVDEKKYIKKVKEEKTPEINLIKGYKHGICYLSIPSFNFRLWKELDGVYAILPKIAKNKHLIIDLQDNSGGGERMYKELLHILKKRRTYHTVLLINRNCASATEAFILKATKLKNVTSMGENTSGQFAYGEVKKHIAPHTGIVVMIPARVYKEWLPYEFKGISPDTRLDPEMSMQYALDYLESV